ncbi:MAG TPA: AAA family ATPase [Armatimonadota bacterium]
MRLLRLNVTGFGSLRERVVEFAPGLTVLLGPNEAGKSTVLHCLAQMLMGKPSERKHFADMTPWDGGPFIAELEYEEGGDRYRITRRFSATGVKANQLHRLGEDGSETLVTQELSEIRNHMAAVFGTGDDRIFYRVFCLTQADLNPLDNFSALREQLERATSGAEVAVTGAVQRVDDRLAILRRGLNSPTLPQNRGRLKVAKDALQEWEVRLSDARRQQRRLGEAREESLRLQQTLTDGSARLEEISAIVETDRRRRELATRLADVKAQYTEAEEGRDRVRKLEADRDRMCGQLAALPFAPADLPGLRARLQAARLGHGPSPLLGWAIIGISALLAAGIALGAGKPLGWVLLLLGIAVGLPMILRAAGRQRDLSVLCTTLGATALQDAQDRAEVAEGLRREYDSTLLALEKIPPLDGLTERSRALALEIAGLEEKLAQIPGAALSAAEAQKLLAEQGRLQAELPRARERERALAQELAVLEQSERDLVELEDGVAYWQQEQARAREEEQTLLLAKDLLEQAGEQAHGTLANPLAERITPLFTAMTGGRYPQVQVQGDANTFQVQPVEVSGRAVQPEELSQGAFDQLVLATRLALGQTLAGPEATPVFLLDDPLLHFDEDRRREALAMLAALSADCQLILATHDERLLTELPPVNVVRMGETRSLLHP